MIAEVEHGVDSQKRRRRVPASSLRQSQYERQFSFLIALQIKALLAQAAFDFVNGKVHDLLRGFFCGCALRGLCLHLSKDRAGRFLS